MQESVLIKIMADVWDGFTAAVVGAGEHGMGFTKKDGGLDIYLFVESLNQRITMEYDPYLVARMVMPGYEFGWCQGRQLVARLRDVIAAGRERAGEATE